MTSGREPTCDRARATVVRSTRRRSGTGRCRRAARTARRARPAAPRTGRGRVPGRTARRAPAPGSTPRRGRGRARRRARRATRAVVEVAQRDAVSRGSARAERGHGAVVRAVRRVAQLGVGDAEERRAQRRVDDLALEAEQVERGRALGGVDRTERVVPLRSLADQLVAERDERFARSLRCAIRPRAEVRADRRQPRRDRAARAR